MKLERWLFSVPLLLLVIPTSAGVPPWSGIIDPSRAVDWSSTGVGAAIVTRTTPCGATIAAYSGPADIINNALAACRNGYVLLGPGTFTLSSAITFGATDNVTLRGSGPTQTFINFTGGSNCGGQEADICAINSTQVSAFDPLVQYGSGAAQALWTAGYAQGTTQIALSTTSRLSVGMTLFLDQLNDQTADTGGAYVCQSQPPCSLKNPADGAGQGRSGRSQIEMKQITAINGNIVTIVPALYNTNWRAAQNPGAWWVGPMLTGVGVEDMTINHGGGGTAVLSGIYLFDCSGCWVKNVKSVDANRNHVWCYLSSNVTVRDSYFYGTLGAATQSYGFEGFGCNNPLVENNIFQHIASPVLFDTTTGGVVGYNFNIDDYYTSAGWQMPGDWDHAAGTSFNLWEGNESVGYIADNVWGTHNQETFFRNWINGRDIACYGSPCTLQTVPIMLYAYSRGINLIGNVLGTPGYHTNYEDRYDLGTTTNPQNTIYVLGYCANVGQISTTHCTADNGAAMSNDSLTPTTLLRWGNYDTATGTVRWVSSEVPTAATPYINGSPVPASHILPASFYLASKPAWWGTMPWPAIGPDVTGGAGPGGHAYAIPAAVCYGATPRDSAGILLFDANACYLPLRRLPPVFL